MKKLLYITVNSKPEELSSCKTVGRYLANAILKKHPSLAVEELDLYKEHVPQLKYNYFDGRSTLVKGEALSELAIEEQNEVSQISRLCDQFIDADIYILAAPMWSLSFPAPLKEYIDCIVQADKTIAFEDQKPHGLLNDKHRIFIYVQSSGANIPWIIRPVLNKGLNYIKDIIEFIGIGKFEELLVDGTGTTELDRQESIERAVSRMDTIVDQI
jgi:FMN-dependent NADH-azoreductase